MPANSTEMTATETSVTTMVTYAIEGQHADGSWKIHEAGITRLIAAESAVEMLRGSDEFGKRHGITAWRLVRTTWTMVDEVVG